MLTFFLRYVQQGSHASVNLVPVNRSVATLRAYLVVCLDLLRKLNSINRQGATPKVGHEVFHIPELTERVDVKQDYVKWLSDPIGDKVRFVGMSIKILGVDSNKKCQNLEKISWKLVAIKLSNRG